MSSLSLKYFALSSVSVIVTIYSVILYFLMTLQIFITIKNFHWFLFPERWTKHKNWYIYWILLAVPLIYSAFLIYLVVDNTAAPLLAKQDISNIYALIFMRIHINYDINSRPWMKILWIRVNELITDILNKENCTPKYLHYYRQNYFFSNWRMNVYQKY